MVRLIFGLVFGFFVGSAHALPTQFVQEGYLTNQNGAPIHGQATLRLRLYAQPAGGAPLFEEIHQDAVLINGYYAVSVGSINPIPDAIFQRTEVFLGLRVNDGDELRPRTAIMKVPAAMEADTAVNVIGDITPNSVTVGGIQVIDAQGKWVGDPTGLRGPAGVNGADGAQGPQGERGVDGAVGPRGPPGQDGAVGAAGSPDTPAQVLGKLVQVDGADSTLESDLIDGLDSLQFMRADVDTSNAANVSVTGSVTSDTVVTTKVTVNGVRGQVGLDVVGNLRMVDNDILGVQRFLFNDPGPDGRLEWGGSSARIFVAPLNDGNEDGFLRLQNGGNGISLEGPVRTSSSMSVEGRLNANAGTTAKDVIINEQEALALGNGVNAADAGNQPSAVLGFAGNGVAHAALGWYPNTGVLELYDTSVGIPNSAFDQGARPYSSFKAKFLRADASVDATDGFSVGGNPVIDSNGDWVGGQIGNAGNLDGLNSDQFMRSDANTGTTGNVVIDKKMTSATLKTGASQFDGTMTLSNRNIRGINRIEINDPGTDGRIEWTGTSARIYVATLNDGNTDGYLRIKNADNGISLESSVRTTSSLDVGTNLNVSGASILNDARIQSQEALVLGNGVDATGVGNQPSAVLGFAGFGVKHAAMSWYAGSGQFELYDTSPASPSDAYDQGTRPYVSLKAQNLRAAGLVDSAGGFSVDGNVIIDGNGGWAGGRVDNANKLDGLDSSQFMRSDGNTGTTGNVDIAGKMTSATLKTGTSEFNGQLNLSNENLVGLNRLAFNDPGSDGRIEWTGTNAQIYVSPLNNGNTDGYLRLKNSDKGISLESPVRTTSSLTVATGLNVGGTSILNNARIQEQESLVLGNGVNAGQVGNKPSAVLGFAGFGVKHAAMSWYAGAGQFELYDTSPASPNDAYDRGSRPYVSLKGQNLTAAGSVEAAGGYSVDGNAVINGSGTWVGAKVSNADKLDGFDSSAFVRSNTTDALSARITALENKLNSGPLGLLDGTYPALFKRYAADGHIGGNGIINGSNYGPSWSNGSTAKRGADAVSDLRRNGALVFTERGRYNSKLYSPTNAVYWGAITFFVKAPTARDVTFDLTISDSVINLNGSMIHQGGMGHYLRRQYSWRFKQGSNVISIRSLHHSDWSALIIYNKWITDHGLEIDWEAMNNALRGN